MAKKKREPTELDKLKQEIANLCTTIGDRSFIIRQAQADVQSMFEKIDVLRNQLIELEG
jgi:septal ring factor EnvC (AmiA/AmiB activator)